MARFNPPALFMMLPGLAEGMIGILPSFISAELSTPLLAHLSRSQLNVLLLRFGYVSFKTVDEAQAAIVGLQGQSYEGRKLTLNFAYSSSIPPVRGREANKAPTPTLYVGNMSFQMNEKDLDTLFADFPNIHEIRVAVDRRTGIFRGFVHVEFVDIESAKAGYQAMKNLESFGRKLVIDYSSSPRREEGSLTAVAAGSRISMGKSIPEGSVEEASPEDTLATESATETATETEGADTSKTSTLQ